VLRRVALLDLETGRFLGQVDGGVGMTVPLFSRTRPELYVPETHYSRGSRGERTDVLTFYDVHSLAPGGEVILPAKRAINSLPVGNAAITDDDGFAVLFNLNPATSVSIVDLVRRRFVEELPTPGCSLVYPAGPRRFAMICADGALLLVSLGADGHVVGRRRSAPFFDPQRDPVTEKAVRLGSRWIFVSFEGMVHELDFSGEEPRFLPPWSLLSPEDREDSWRIGGQEHLAIHEGSGRLYSLMHQGGPDTHKEMGTELWVYDVAKHERLQRIPMQLPGLTYMGVPLEFGRKWPRPFNRIMDWLLWLLPNVGVDEVRVTRDAHPLLVTGAMFSGSLAVYDALSGEFVRRVMTGNSVNAVLQTPFAEARP